MPASELLRDRERLATAVQEAGAVAKKFFRGPLKQWTKGQGDSPVTEADIASNDLLHKRLVEARRRLAVGGKRERSDAACGAPRLGGRSDRRHARLHRRPRGLVGVGGAGRGWPAGGRRAVRAGDRGAVPVDRGRRRDAERRRRSGPVPAAASTAPASAGPSACWSGSRSSGTGIVPMPRIHSLALRLARVAARRARCRHRRRQQPRLGPCGCRPFGARSRRPDDRARRPGSDLQPARSGARHRCSRRAATGTRRWPISSVRRPASRCNVGRRACSTQRNWRCRHRPPRSNCSIS